MAFTQSCNEAMSLVDPLSTPFALTVSTDMAKYLEVTDQAAYWSQNGSRQHMAYAVPDGHPSTLGNTLSSTAKPVASYTTSSCLTSSFVPAKSFDFAENCGEISSRNAVLSLIISGAVVWLINYLSRLVRTWSRSREYRKFVQWNECATISALPKPLFAGLRHKLQLFMAHRNGDLLDGLFNDKYKKHGPTHALHDHFGRPTVIHTIDPTNLDAMLNKTWTHWRPSKARGRCLEPLAQEGLLLNDGESWHTKRKLVQRHIGSKRAKDVRRDEEHIQQLFEAIGLHKEDGWTDVVDVFELFQRMALDMSTTYLFGTSAESQAAGLRHVRNADTAADRDMNFTKAYETVRTYLSWRSKLGSWYWLADGPRYRKACAYVEKYAGDIIAKAIEHSKAAKEDETDDGRFGLIDALLRDLGDADGVREVAMDLFIAGQNMTGTMSAWLFAQLERHPDIFQRIRQDVISKFGTEDDPKAPLTWDNLQACQSLQFAILETTRMYPLLPNIGRNAKTDTVLPRGGGPDGMQPIAVPKGAFVTANVYLIHRRAEEWGDDAWKFKPDRWNGRKFGPEYATFGGGPRICVGQQVAKAEMSYLVARVVQRFSEIEAPAGQDNLEKGYKAIVAPKHGVKLRFTAARPHA